MTVESIREALGDGRNQRTAARIVLITYVYLIYSRVFEAASLIGLGNLYIMLVVSALGLFMILASGDFMRAARTPCGTLLIAFTLWCGFILPFSSWKSTSFQVYTGVWVKSVAAYFIVVGLTKTFADSRKTATAMAIGAITSLGFMLVANRTGGRLESFGSLGNANEVSFHILLGLPYILLLMSRATGFKKLLYAPFPLISLIYSLKTASRAGLIMVAVMTLIAMTRLSFANKAKIVAVGALGAFIGISALNEEQLDRFRTLFSNDTVTAAQISAKESADSRKRKLNESIELTLKNPLFGVGMGVFTPASADLEWNRGEKPLWIASHNAYTQISSETGFVGIGLILSVFATSLVMVAQLERQARQVGLQDICNLCLCLVLTMVTLGIHFFFDSIAYEYYLPIMSGLATALVMTSRPLIEAAKLGRLNSSLVPIAEPEFAGIAANVSSGSFGRTDGRLVPTAVGAGPNTPRGGNPYRFGRRRPTTTVR